MITFTKEQLIERAKYGIERYTKAVAGFPRHMDVAMDLELARIALASLEAAPVAFINGAREPVMYGEHIGIPIGTHLYTAPPAPVSVPDDIDTRMKNSGMLSAAEIIAGQPIDAFMKHAGVVDLESLLKWAEMRRTEFLRMQAKYELGDNQKDDMYEWVISHVAAFSELHVNIRAAMLQGADGNSPVIPDGLSTVCAETYQVVGVMAEALGVFDSAEVQKVLDNLSQQKLVHSDVLPFSLPAVTPAPVVPGVATIESTYPDVQTSWQDAKMYAEGWNACRAAMLERQSVDHVVQASPTGTQAAPALDSLPKNDDSPTSNSPVIPDGLNIRAVAALREAVRNQWLNSDEFADKVYWKSMHDIANEIISAMLAAAPQQEVNNDQ